MNRDTVQITSVPKIIHQTWRDNNVPHDLKAFQRTWKEKHPGWDYRFWTDSDNVAFVEERYASFLPKFLEYPKNIMRVDAVRYLVLQNIGGIYVDLDFECLAPMDDLIENRQLLFGLEPDRHCKIPPAAVRNMRQIVCNAWMASTPQHPFWNHLIQRLVASSHNPNTLEATGPFMLSEAVSSYSMPRQITLLPSQILYPLDKIQKRQGAWKEDSFRATAKKHALAVHHWHGSWWDAETKGSTI